ncbi:MAG: 1-deoxy-D-xylulose-5-phosphate reductoisomerase [Treponema sp.]|jgi:1-deoxy-D-xylulose-5-phosphate reductoisomerase|nr:1-deoxy-D-xylulose-5-phosphate reductoisomerase [Treponema sp.]
MKKKVAVLGATGSIGRSALDVIRAEGDSYEPVLFSSHRNLGGLLALSQEFPAAALALTGVETEAPPQGVLRGMAGLRRGIAEAAADMVVNGIAGAAGLEPSLLALEAGADLALANKETVVMAAPLVFALAAKRGRRILPVDSEHAAIFNLLEAHGREAVEELILTASGGPFRGCSREELSRISPDEALRHPTWKMGPKISVDSATLANKGLEVIEAAGLFDFPPGAVTVAVHPQSIVHSMVRLKNGAIYAELSQPDMRLPIHNALAYPLCGPCAFGRLDFNGLTLEFEKPDLERFPLLPLAYQAARLGGPYPVIYNAANEAGVAAFLAKSIGFLDIPQVVEYVMSNDWQAGTWNLREAGVFEGLALILETDRKARNAAEAYIKTYSR